MTTPLCLSMICNQRPALYTEAAAYLTRKFFSEKVNIVFHFLSGMFAQTPRTFRKVATEYRGVNRLNLGNKQAHHIRSCSHIILIIAFYIIIF